MLYVGDVIVVQALFESSVEGTLAQGQGIVERVFWAHCVERSGLSVLGRRRQHVPMSTEGTRGSRWTPAVPQQSLDAILAEAACVDVLHARGLASKDMLGCSCVVPGW